jgi:hypothetical protein
MRYLLVFVVAVLVLASLLSASLASPSQALDETDGTLLEAAVQTKDHWYEARAATPAASHLASGQAAATQAPDVPAGLGGWSSIVFQSNRAGNWEIYLARGDGTQQTRLTNHGAIDVHPRLNRGATAVVFTSERDGKREIYAVAADGSNLRRLTTYSTADDDPTWSPDSSRIAFSRYIDDNWEIPSRCAIWRTRPSRPTGHTWPAMAISTPTSGTSWSPCAATALRAWSRTNPIGSMTPGWAVGRPMDAT